MLDWQVTAEAIYCDAVEDDVVIMVLADGSVKCTGYSKYGATGNPEAPAILKKKSRILNRRLACEGPQDYRLTNYRDNLLEQEKKISGQ
jgi:hypothetical protein